MDEEQVFSRWQSKARHREKSRGGGSRTEHGSEDEGRNQDRSWDQFAAAAKLDHPVSAASGQKKPSSAIAPGTALAPRWCPPGLMPSQRRRIQWMRVHNMREEVAEKERDEHFNDIRPVILTK
jgi:hypothetical protein